MTSGTLRGMKDLSQNCTTRFVTDSGAGSGVEDGAGAWETQHCTSDGPGQRFLTKLPLQVLPGLFLQSPDCPLVPVQDLDRQHFTLVGSLGQAPVTVKPMWRGS